MCCARDPSARKHPRCALAPETPSPGTAHFVCARPSPRDSGNNQQRQPTTNNDSDDDNSNINNNNNNNNPAMPVLCARAWAERTFCARVLWCCALVLRAGSATSALTPQVFYSWCVSPISASMHAFGDASVPKVLESAMSNVSALT